MVTLVKAFNSVKLSSAGHHTIKQSHAERQCQAIIQSIWALLIISKTTVILMATIDKIVKYGDFSKTTNDFFNKEFPSGSIKLEAKTASKGTPLVSSLSRGLNGDTFTDVLDALFL